ncbi:flavodoxin reductase family protein [Candidatus Nitrososphaera evergladensis SR1]|uniref:Flavodoxin reductase family protein n=1 Tax=Candidatus Nitrososphaera evergladensis SR1 TaxID=1459636 RepID=A0A075MWG7_9ARCH|nr:Rieske 2Fe-2S domain-containing protein [Candidatus Nitrososphaera evergladensis]AIF85473.1 flavodoxin reductase family protein [Candidatus Nitrososphaera evergladensis SR1]
MTRYNTTFRKADLQERKPVRVDIDGKAIVLALVSGKIYAMDAVCSHEGGPLEEGSIEEYSLICPWHQGIFDIRTAKASPETDWVTDLRSYRVEVEEKSGLIAIDTDSGASHSDSGSSPRIARQENAVAVDDVPARPLKFELKLLEKVSQKGTDIMSFRFSRSDSENYLNYKAGQYSIVDLGTREDPEGPTRSFTIASSPTEKEGILISTRIRDTPFKQKLSKLDIGASVKITAPAGKFTLPEDNSSPVVLLTGGGGVTPFRSMIKYATDKQLALKITMFDSNRNRANVLYKDEFDRWANLNKNLKIIYTITGEQEQPETPQSLTTPEWIDEKGMINKAMLARHLSIDELKDSIFYTCGPPAMLNAMRKLLSEEIGVSGDRIRTEAFTGY